MGNFHQRSVILSLQPRPGLGVSSVVKNLEEDPHSFSQLVSEDGSTWADEIQDHKQHFNGSFSYPFYSVDGSGERTKSIHTVRSKTWLSKVKTALIKQNPTLGTYHVGCKPALQEFDVVLFPGNSMPRIVLLVQDEKVLSLSTVSDMIPSRHKHTDAVRRRWNTASSCGPGVRSTLSTLVYSVDDLCSGRWDLVNSAIKVEVQLLPRTGEIDFARATSSRFGSSEVNF